MRVEFIGKYEKHEIKKTSKDKDYVCLSCVQSVDNKKINILLFNKGIFKNLDMFKQGDDINVIFETWYNKKNDKQVIICKDIVAC